MTVVLLEIGLKIADITKYNEFINGKNSELLKELFNIDKEYSLLDATLNRDEAFEEAEGNN